MTVEGFLKVSQANPAISVRRGPFQSDKLKIYLNRTTIELYTPQYYCINIQRADFMFRASVMKIYFIRTNHAVPEFSSIKLTVVFKRFRKSISKRTQTGLSGLSYSRNDLTDVVNSVCN